MIPKGVPRGYPGVPKGNPEDTSEVPRGTEGYPGVPRVSRDYARGYPCYRGGAQGIRLGITSLSCGVRPWVSPWVPKWAWLGNPLKSVSGIWQIEFKSALDFPGIFFRTKCCRSKRQKHYEFLLILRGFLDKPSELKIPQAVLSECLETSRGNSPKPCPLVLCVPSGCPLGTPLGAPLGTQVGAPGVPGESLVHPADGELGAAPGGYPSFSTGKIRGRQAKFRTGNGGGKRISPSRRTQPPLRGVH